MKDRRTVPVTLAIIALIFFVRAGYAYWALDKIVPIAAMMQLPYDDPMSAERFAKDLRFSVVVFGAFGLAAVASGVGAVLQRRWARWIWLVTCTVMSFSLLVNFLFRPSIAVRQFDLVALCIVSWWLLRGHGLSRASAP
jgi:hypothetical protein